MNFTVSANSTGIRPIIRIGLGSLTEQIIAMTLRGGISLVGLMMNVTMGTVIYRTPWLKDRFIIPFALAFSDGATCLFGIFSAGKKILFNSLYPYWFIPRFMCLALPEIPLRMLGGVVSPILAFIIAVERYVAVRYPLAFRARFFPHRIRRLALCSFAMGVIAVAFGYIEAYTQDGSDLLLPLHTCSQGNSAGFIFNNLIFGLVSILGILSGVLACFTLHAKRVHSRKNMAAESNKESYRKDLNLTRPMVFIVISNSLFVSLPNIVFTTVMLGAIAPSSFYRSSGYFITLYVFNSSLNFVFFSAFSSEFKTGLRKLWPKKNTVNNIP